MALGKPWISSSCSSILTALAAGGANVDFNGQDLPIGFIDDVKGSKGPTVMQGVVHKIESPHRVGLGRRNKRNLGQLGDAFFGSSG
jgi:hypothetical protein